MDTITHALSGALLARATTTKNASKAILSLRVRLAAGALAAAFPDTDFVIRLLFDPLTYFNTHRGITHSIILMPIWAWLLALLFSAFSRGKYKWKAFYTVSLMGIGIHIAGDVITTYGTMILSPLSDYRAAFDTTFIIDPYFSAIILIGLIVSALLRSKRTAITALTVLSIYIGFQNLQHYRAIELGEQQVSAINIKNMKVAALPQPLSPFNWKIVLYDENHYHVAFVNLIRTRAPAPVDDSAGFFGRINAIYRPINDLVWQHYARFGNNDEDIELVKAAWGNKGFEGFRRFALFPKLYRVDRSEVNTCVWFTDLRFEIEGRTPPFRFGMCQVGEQWELRELPRFKKDN